MRLRHPIGELVRECVHVRDDILFVHLHPPPVSRRTRSQPWSQPGMPRPNRSVRLDHGYAMGASVDQMRCYSGSGPRWGSVPGSIVEVCCFEAAIGDATGYLFPFANNSAFAVRDEWPIAAGDGLACIYGFPGQGIERADIG